MVNRERNDLSRSLKENMKIFYSYTFFQKTHPHIFNNNEKHVRHLTAQVRTYFQNTRYKNKARSKRRQTRVS